MFPVLTSSYTGFTSRSNVPAGSRAWSSAILNRKFPSFGTEPRLMASLFSISHKPYSIETWKCTFNNQNTEDSQQMEIQSNNMSSKITAVNDTITLRNKIWDQKWKVTKLAWSFRKINPINILYKFSPCIALQELIWWMRPWNKPLSWKLVSKFSNVWCTLGN